MSNIPYKKSNFNKQYQLISKHYNVLMIDTINNTSKFINYFTNKNTPPIFTSTTFIVSTINTITTTTLTSYNWFVKSNVTSNVCNTYNSTYTITGIAVTNVNVNEKYVSTKYYIDWMKNYVYKKMKKNIQDAARKDLGHIKDKDNLTESDFILFAYNLNIAGGGENSYDREFSYKVGDKTYKYNMSLDMHNLNRYQTCGLTVANNGGEIENAYGSLSTPAIGFRKEYIVKMIPTTLEFN